MTANRFDIEEAPEFIFLRQGKFYRYKGKDLTITAFVNFVDNLATSKIKPETVQPLPVSGL